MLRSIPFEEENVANIQAALWLRQIEIEVDEAQRVKEVLRQGGPGITEGGN